MAKYETGSPGANLLYAMAEDLDTAVGQVLQKVDDLGIEDNTYIIYASDNGSFFNHSLSGTKGTLMEGGVRVPMIVKGPGVQANSVSRVPVAAKDLFTTITDLAGVADPLPAGVEGTSLEPLLHNGGNLLGGNAQPGA